MEEKITLKDKLQYKIDNMFSRGSGVLIFWLAILSFLIVFIATVLVVLLKISPAGEDVPKMSEAFWMSLMRTLDPGTMSGDQGWGFRLMMFFVTLGGIFIISDSTAKTRTLTTKHPFLNSEIVRKGANEVVEK